ncbi:hypothetical protein P4O66_017797, partial [Electrophorus voltai]
SCYGLLTAQACSVHRRVPQWAALEGCLSAQNEARCRDQLQSNTVLYEQKPAKKWAAVLVCLCMVGGEPAFLFTLRSSKLRGRHKGDVSFAGGKRDAMDRNVVDTALREACEELGISVTENEVWGLLRPLRDKSGMLIAPVLANLGPLESLKFHPNPSEVFSAYAPYMGCAEEEKELFWQYLHDCFALCPAEDLLMVCGDLNGHVGRAKDGHDFHGGFGYGTRNDDGCRILDFAEASDLVVCNAFFKKRTNDLVTYTSGGSHWHGDVITLLAPLMQVHSIRLPGSTT